MLVFSSERNQEGVGSWNRIGRYIWNKSIELDLNLNGNHPTPPPTQCKTRHSG